MKYKNSNSLLKSTREPKWKGYRLFTLCFLFFVLGATTLFAQQQQLSGVIKDATGEPVIGANVTEKGTANGTISDLDGKFKLSVSPNATLVVSYIGYITQEIRIQQGKPVMVTLVEDAKTLDEVVVVGYGTMRKKDVTGSVIQIRPDKLASEAPKTVQDVLRGTPGLKVGLDSSAKGGGSLEIRGNRSVSEISTGGPLLILDNMPFYGELSEINPEDIGQIDVLKDASAAAVYGAKAANGVVIITTKKGKKGKPTVNFSAKVGFVNKSKYREVYSANEYMQFREDWYKTPTYGFNADTGNYEAYQTGNIKPGYYDHPSRLPNGVSVEDWRAYTSQGDDSDASIYGKRLFTQADEIMLNNYVAGKSFDWYDHAFQTGFNQDYSVSISGGSDNMNYYMSLGYLSNEGAVRGNEYRAIRGNMKLSGNVTDWLEISANVNFQDRTDGDLPLDAGSATANSPYGSYRDAEGNLVVHPMGTRNTYNKGYNYDFNNQYEELEKGFTVLNSIFTAKIKLPFNITYSFNASPRFQWFYDRWFQSSEHPDWAPISHGANRKQHKNFDWSINNTINWDYTFADKHHVNLTLVQEAEEYRSWQDNIEARNIQPTDALGFHNIGSAGKTESSFSSKDSHHTATGMLARLFYSYDDRYMMTTSIRRDGYSAFGQNNPYATFPSIALAWTFTNEKFFNWEPMNYGKLRISWGENGNRSLKDPYQSVANLEPGSRLHSYLTSTGNLVETQYLKISRMANPSLRWEKSQAYNFAVDYGFLDNRISGTLEAYVINTKDMIMNRKLPGFTGFQEIATNLGQVQNRGFELTINTQNIKKQNFEWSTSFNFSYNKNEIKHLYYENEDILDDNGNIIGSKERDEYGKWFIGKPIGAIWDYRVTGIWQPNEADEAKKVGQGPGDPKVANNYTKDDIVNADGTVTPVYNDKDKEFLGQDTSPYIWSMRNSFTIYKNFEFSFNIYSQMGAKFLDGHYLNQHNASEVDYGHNVVKRDYWTPDNLTNGYARLNSKGPKGVNSPQRIVNASFIRLENISLAYNVPKSVIAKWKINNLKIYGSVRNAALWTKDDWRYGDIETKGFASRVFSMGVNINL